MSHVTAFVQMPATSSAPSTTADDSLITEKDLELFSAKTRHSFLSLFVVVTTLSLVGNVAAIFSISRRKFRRFQKTCIISLALSDILSTVAIALINIVSFIDKIKYWPLGSFLCRFLPACQIWGILASSVTLMFIAVDRYRNVVYALNKSWNPRLSFCLTGVLAIWLACFGVSYPMYTYLFMYEQPVERGIIGICVVRTAREKLINYYSLTTALIFLPLLAVFLWCYYNIAALVWKHRKPFFLEKEPEEKSSSSGKTPPPPKRRTRTQDDARVDKKIRTFKVIVALMTVFIVCRLPYFAVVILKSAKTQISDEEGLWYTIFACMALQIVNCFLNPLLYTFLHFSIKAWHKVQNFVLEFLCFCCSRREFESFEKENPFLVENYENKKNSKVRFEEEGKY